MRTFSFLSTSNITLETLLVLNEFERCFGNSTINRRAGWQLRIRRDYSASVDIKTRDVLFASESDKYLGLQQYCIIDSNAYAEGIYIRPECRGQGLGVAIRNELFATLSSAGINRFYIGKSGFGCSYMIKEQKAAQGLAQSDLFAHNCVDVERRKNGTIKSYGIVL